MRWPFSTDDLPGTAGRLRDRPEDFVVEEIPAYEPAGAGDHTYLTVEKTGITTPEAVRRVASALGVPRRAVGYAGLKDKHAVARQTFSVEHVPPARAETALADVRGLRLLRAKRHGNKLRLGHLRGNRFRITIRDACPDAAQRAAAVLDVLRTEGAPNLFGPQRFGDRGDNHEVGRLLVRGDAAGALERLGAGAPREGRSAERALRARPRRLLRLYVSAYQSHLFNQLVAGRLGRLGTMEDGDLAYLHDRGAVFAVADARAEQPRADRLEISPSAPLYGLKTVLASGAPGERERALLAAEDLGPGDFKVAGVGSFRGERRPVRVPVRVPEAGAAVETADDGALVVTFELPRGSYATTVLREIMKPTPVRQP